MGILWSLLTSRLGGWVVGGATVLIVLGILKLEHNAKLRAQARAATAEQGMKIGFESYVKLYQEREQIKEKYAKEKEKIHASSLDDLVRRSNNPGGVLPSVRPDSIGGVKGFTVVRDSAGKLFKYENFVRR